MLTKELIFIFSAILDAAVDQIDQDVRFDPETRKFYFQAKYAEPSPYERGAMDCAGNAIATIFSQKVGKTGMAMGTGDVLRTPVGDTCFEDAVKQWVKEAVLAGRKDLPDVYPFAETLAKLCMENIGT